MIETRQSAEFRASYLTIYIIEKIGGLGKRLETGGSFSFSSIPVIYSSLWLGDDGSKVSVL